MHPHTKQILDEFKKNFKDFAFNSKTHFGRMADRSAILNFCEKEVQQALKSQAEEIGTRLFNTTISKSDDVYDVWYNEMNPILNEYTKTD